MTKPKTMNNIIKILIIVVFFQNSHSQKTINNEIEDANYVKKNIVFFYKNSWKPFTGNIIVETVYKNQKLTTKIKFKNGFDILEEYINPKNKKLVLTRKVNKINTYDIEVYDSINLKTVFKKNTIFTDTTKIQKKFVINYYCENSVRTKIEKLNGFVKSENTKTYFVNGMKTKIEYFYDSELKKIKESFGIFCTEIGNIEYEEDQLIYDGDYTKWNIKGEITETGKYKEGKKI
jgi:hypothetical protein